MDCFYGASTEQRAKLSGPWCASFSGGKDSTSLVTWIEWLRRTGQITPVRPQLVQSDTNVEDPALNAISREMMDLLTRSGWQCAVVEPRIHEKLYNRILGIGNSPVHAGGRKMRWCTRATKIDPMRRWRREHSSGLVITGVRLGESDIRNEKLLKVVSCSAGGECGLPPVDDNTYGPIINWSLCHVIDWLNGAVAKCVRDVLADIFALTPKLVSTSTVCVWGNRRLRHSVNPK